MYLELDLISLGNEMVCSIGLQDKVQTQSTNKDKK